jgi:AcrR family transcriptional regulator
MSRVQARADRTIEILEAACRVIARDGSRALRVQDVAREAGVSKALVHYYHATKEDLLARAFEYAEDRTWARAQAEIATDGRAADRLERLLLVYFGDEPDSLEDWILWREVSTLALFDKRVQPGIERVWTRWTAWVEDAIRQGQADGSIGAEVEPNALAVHLTALVDGLASLQLLGLIDRSAARELVQTVLRSSHVIHGAASNDVARRADEAELARDLYFHDLGRSLGTAVSGLEPFVTTKREAVAIETVSTLISRLAAAGLRRP